MPGADAPGPSEYGAMSGDSSQFAPRELLTVLEASRQINASLELPKILEQVADHAMRVLEAEAASVLLLDEKTDEFVFEAATGPAGAELIGERFDANLGVAGRAARMQQVVREDDASQSEFFFPGVDQKTHMHTSALLAGPLVHQGRVLGVVEVINPTDKDHFAPRDAELLELFANMAAAAVSQGRDFAQVKQDMSLLRESLAATEIVGQSPAIRGLTSLCERVAKSNATVMLTGDTGTGKELAARQIHEMSDRRAKPFVAVNCAALPESLMESELFGHEKGAFTGASEQRLGRFELADGGSLFLDEIGELSQPIQVKLLRVLQERELVRVGGSKTIRCDVRIIAATHRDLQSEMEAGRFRSDLYYRLYVFPIRVPPLRERLDDLPLLVDHFLDELAPTLGIARPGITDEAISCMMRYPWPGNIRELRNIVERCALLASDGQIGVEDLPVELAKLTSANDKAGSAADEQAGDLSLLASHERALIVNALKDADWNQSEAARQLGVTRDHLRYRIKKYQIRKPG